MFAIAFDLVVADTDKNHPKGIAQAYRDIGIILSRHGFTRVQGSLYITEKEDMALLFRAIYELRAQPWLPKSIRDIRAFRIEQWSDFTDIVKNQPL
ncbi:MAG: virulence factor [Alphaproteobacteria bacterium]|nr:virulence factor [Alphaproteobacteria bacterium]